MAKLITGIQGSGKSYHAMHFIASSQDKYMRVFSNIEDIINNKTIYSLDINSFIVYAIKQCYNIMVANSRNKDYDFNLTNEEIFEKLTNQSASYNDAIKHLQNIKILPPIANEDNRTLIVIDEAQDYFGKGVKLSPELLWFITQHRHLYIEVLLLTQDVSLLRNDYKLFNEVYDGVPPTKQFDKNVFTYHQYAGLPMDSGNYVGKVKLRKNQEIFKMYTSGDRVDSPNILKRFYFLLSGAIAMILFGAYMLLDMFGGTKVNTTADNNKDINTSYVKVIQQAEIKNTINNGMHYINLNCIANICTQDTYKIKINVDDLQYIVKLTESEFLQVKKHSATLATVTLLASQEFINLFQGAYNENKENKGFSLIN